MKKKYNNFIKYSIDIIILLIISYYFINCTIYAQSNPNYNIYFLTFLMAIIYYLIYIGLSKLLKVKELYLKVAIVVGSVLVYSVWNIIAKTIPVSDYAVLINGAKSVLNGTFSKLSFNPQNYFYFYNFQIGYTLYLSLLMKIFGSSLVTLKIIEILVLSISNLLVYILVSKIYSKKAGLISAIIYGTLLFNIGGSSIINNQHISTFFILISLYLLTKDNKIAYILCSLFLAISYILRSSSIIFVIAIICYYIWKLLKSGFHDYKKQVINIFMICAVFFSFLKVFDFTIQNVHLVPNSAISANAKYFKFLLGIQDSGMTGTITTSAEKTQIYYDLKNYNFDYDKYNKDTKEYLIQKYEKDKRATITHILNKMYMFTSYPDNQIDFAITKNIGNRTLYFIKYYGYAQYVLIIILSFISIIISLREISNVKDNYDILFKIIFIGFFLCHMFIEVQTRYRYDQYLILAILSSSALEYILNKFKLENTNNKVNKKTIK